VIATYTETWVYTIMEHDSIDETIDAVMETDADVPHNGQIEGDEGENNDIYDESPEFINDDDVVEVQVDDDNAPMDDDDEEDDDEDENNNIDEQANVIDMSRVKVESHKGPVYALSSHFNPETNQLSIVSGGGDDKAFLHQISTQTDSKLLQHAHTDSVSAVAFNVEYIPPDANDISKNPRLIAVGAYDGATVLYNADTGELVKELEGPTDVEWLCFHPKGGTVLMVGSAADGTVWMYHMLSSMDYKCLQVFVGHESSVTDGSFSPDGKWAITCSADGTVRIWAPRTGLCKHIFRVNNYLSQQSPVGLTTIAVNGGTDGHLVIVGAEDGTAHICHTGTKKVVASLRHYEIPDGVGGNEDELQDLPMSVEAVGFAPAAVNPNWCATGGVDGVLKVWDLSVGAGQCRQTCRPPTQQQQQNDSNNTNDVNTPGTPPVLGGITRLQWHPTLPIIITSSTSGSVNLWDARNGQLLHTQTGSTDVVNDMNVHFVDGGAKAIIVSGSDDNCIRIFDLDIKSIMLQQK
jgi:angio-associated migratory cell protein